MKIESGRETSKDATTWPRRAYCENLRDPIPPPILPSERRERPLALVVSATAVLAADKLFAEGFLPIFGLILERSQGFPGDARKNPE